MSIPKLKRCYVAGPSGSGKNALIELITNRSFPTQSNSNFGLKSFNKILEKDDVKYDLHFDVLKG